MQSPLIILADFGNQRLCFRKMLLSGRLAFLEDLRASLDAHQLDIAERLHQSCRLLTLRSTLSTAMTDILPQPGVQ